METRRSGPMGRVMLGLIWVYQRSFSPLFYLMGVRCRHQPSCSAYGVDAFKKHRFARAFWLTSSRVLRCHPFGSSGFDPVPDDAPNAGWRFWRLGDWSWTERDGVNTANKKMERPEDRSI